MKKFVFFALIIMLFALYLVPDTYASPAGAIYSQYQCDAMLQAFQDRYNSGDYEGAYEILKNNDMTAVYDKLKIPIDDTLGKFKQKLLLLSHAYEREGDIEQALSILVENSRYYSTDENVTSTIKRLKNILSDRELVDYNGEVFSLAFKPLLAFPEYALTSKNPNANILDREYITPREFRSILSELYDNGYVLVDSNYLSSDRRLPEGKRPIILIFDNVCYGNDYKCQIDRLIINNDGEIATYTGKKSIRDRISTDNEFVPIMENFIHNNPDFSFRSARGIITLSGENGILGYKTQHSNANYKYEVKKVSAIVSKLKRLGWEFGSCGYSNLDMTISSPMDYAKNLFSFENEVASIVGKTSCYFCPNGNIDKQSENFSQAQDDYTYFLVADNEAGCSDGLLHTTLVGGETLRERSEELSPFFDAQSIYDPMREVKYN